MAEQPQTVMQLIRWAWTQELNKVGKDGTLGTGVSSSSWSMVYDVGIYGTTIDTPLNQWGCVPDFSARSDPHPDALLISEAVNETASMAIDLTADWNPFPDWEDPHGLIAMDVKAAVDKAMLRSSSYLPKMVIRCAILGHGPEWRAEQPKHRLVERAGKPVWFIKRTVKDKFGRTHEIEQDGFNKRTQRPLKGAYRKHCLSHFVTSDALDRLDWQLWVAAMDQVKIRISKHLTKKILADGLPSRTPWIAKKKPETDRAGERVE